MVSAEEHTTHARTRRQHTLARLTNHARATAGTGATRLPRMLEISRRTLPDSSVRVPYPGHTYAMVTFTGHTFQTVRVRCARAAAETFPSPR
jgi:hypothetical protein